MNRPDGAHALLLLLSGPAGTGKTTLCERFVRDEEGAARLVTATTRPPRPGEVDGRDYFFLSEESFQSRLEAGGFIEWAPIHGRRYGTPRAETMALLGSGRPVIGNIDVQGAANFRRAAAEEAELGRRLVTVFIHPPSLDELRARLIGRGSSAEDVARRMATAEREVAAWPDFDYCFTTRDREADYATLRAIWEAERWRVRR